MLEVLLVDDEPTLREIGKLYLEDREQFQVETADDGVAALAKILSHPYQVVISDYDMPNMNGIELLREVKEKLPDQPFIIFTGKGREEVVIDALNLGADFYLQKGGQIKAQYTELAHKCRRAAERKASQDQISHLARLYSFLYSVNRCVHSIRRRDELLEEISKIAVREGGFHQIAITVTHPVHGHPEVAAVGKNETCSNTDSKITRSTLLPTSFALQNGRYHICADHRTYKHNKEDRDLYLMEGILSSAAFPIQFGDKIFGSITFHSSEPAFFNEEEVLLLLEITESLSLGFELMNRGYEQEKLEDSLQLAWHAIDASSTPIFLLDGYGKIVYGNTALTEYSGRMNDAIKGKFAYNVGFLTDPEWNKIQNLLQDKGGKIKRVKSDENNHIDFNESLSVRPFNYQGKAFFWIRIEIT